MGKKGVRGYGWASNFKTNVPAANELDFFSDSSLTSPLRLDLVFASRHNGQKGRGDLRWQPTSKATLIRSGASRRLSPGDAHEQDGRERQGNEEPRER